MPAARRVKRSLLPGVSMDRFDLSWFIPSLVKYRKLFGDVLVASFFLQLLGLSYAAVLSGGGGQGARSQRAHHVGCSCGRPARRRVVRSNPRWPAHLCPFAHHQSCGRRELGARASTQHLQRLPIWILQVHGPWATIVARIREPGDRSRRSSPAPRSPSASMRCFTMGVLRRDVLLQRKALLGGARDDPALRHPVVVR